jgi:hypothetical protein
MVVVLTVHVSHLHFGVWIQESKRQKVRKYCLGSLLLLSYLDVLRLIYCVIHE